MFYDGQMRLFFPLPYCFVFPQSATAADAANFARFVAGATAALDVTAELPFVHQMDLSLEFSGAIFARISAWI